MISYGHKFTTDEIIASSRKCLHHSHIIPEHLISRFTPPCQVVDQPKRGGPHDDEVENHRHEDAKYGSEVVDNMMSLICEHYEDGVEEAKERERREERKEVPVEESFTGEVPN